MQKNKYIARAAVGFFSVLIVLTFCSRSIYRSTLPKVRTVLPSSGVLKLSAYAQSIELSTDNPMYQYIPCELPEGLRIVKAHVRAGDQVLPGDPLFTFYAPSGEMQLQAVRSELEKASLAREAWEYERKREELRLREQFADTQTEDERQLIAKELKILTDGYYSGYSEQEWRERIKSLNTLANELALLHENEWQLLSDFAGIVCSVYVSEGMLYEGVEPLISLAKDDQAVFVCVKLGDSLDIQSGNWLPLICIDTVNEELEAVFLDQYTIQAELPQKISHEDIAHIELRFESAYQRILVPNSAFHGRKLYVVEREVGNWGTTVYKVRESTVSIRASDEEYTAVIEGIMQRDKIIVWSDSELFDGQIVIVEDQWD